MRSELIQVRQLLAALAEQNSGTVSLPGDLADARRFTAAFAQHSGLESLEIKISKWTPTDDKVDGEGTVIAAGGQTGRVSFRASGRDSGERAPGRAYFRLIFTPDSETIPGIFPDFSERLFEGFAIGAAMLLLEIAADDEGEPEISLEVKAECDLRAAMPLLIALLGGQEKLALRGPVELVAGHPHLRLSAGLLKSNQVRLPYFDFPLPLDLALIATADEVEQQDEQEVDAQLEGDASEEDAGESASLVAVAAYFELLGELPFPGSEPIEVRAGFRRDTSVLMFHAAVEGVSRAGLDQFQALLKDIDLDALLPDSFAPPALLLSSVSFTLTTDPLDVLDVFLEIVPAFPISEPRLEIVPPVALRDVVLLLGVISPLSPDRIPVLRARGQLEVDPETVFEASVELPGLTLSSGTTEDSRIALNKLLGYLGAPTPPGAPQVDFTRLYLNAAPRERRFDISGSLDAQWILDTGRQFSLVGDAGLEVDLAATPKSLSGWLEVEFEQALDDVAALPVELTGLYLAIQYARQEGVAAELRASLEIAGYDLHLTAEHDGPGEGWQFAGRTGPGQQLPIGELLDDLTRHFGDIQLPSAVAGLTVSDLAVTLNTKSKNFTFSCRGQLPIGENAGGADDDGGDGLELELAIELLHQEDGKFLKRFGGNVLFSLADQPPLQFALTFAHESAATSASASTFVAAFQSPDGVTVDVHDLVAPHLPAEVPVPRGLDITLNSAWLAYRKTGAASRFLFAIDMGSGVNLSNLPLVGKMFPPEQTIKLAYRVVAASLEVPADEVASVNALLPTGVAALPAEEPLPRFGLATTVQFGDETFNLSLPVDMTATASESPGALPGGATSGLPVEVGDSAESGIQWFSLEKAFGPVQFRRIGARFHEQRIWFYLDASISLGGITLSLDGLSVDTPLDRFDPRFGLLGMGVQYRGGPIQITGAFLTNPSPPPSVAFEYSGKVTIKAEAVALTAIGSYAQFKSGAPSLFIYAVLDYPLGGPSFFFVTGLAAGFGYNRLLKTPEIDEVEEFPLVAVATGSVKPTGDVGAELRRLSKYISPSPGENFLAIGVKFTSFKMIDSFVLLTVAFGERFEINVLGLASMVAPTPLPGAPPVTPLAEVHMALKATFIPEEGFLGVQAQLTASSYCLSRDCRLTGGFAFFAWFLGPNAGDFVITVGGYHPLYKVPDHFPRVPRLGFNWRVNSSLSIKGEAYFALTPHALMAGGKLQATWRQGSLAASFTIGADFLVAWKPFFYDARVYVRVSVSYTFKFFGRRHIRVSVGADLHIWGPDFAGVATIDIEITSFTVRFGASSASPQPISWDEFRQSFLPADNEIAGLSVKDGLVKTLDRAGDDTAPLHWVIDPKNLCLVTNSVIPSAAARIGEQDVREVYHGRDEAPKPLTLDLFDTYDDRTDEDVLREFLEVRGQAVSSASSLLAQVQTLQSSETQDGTEITQFDVAPMAVRRGDTLRSRHQIRVTRNGASAERMFQFTPVLKKVPAALWKAERSLKPDVNPAESFVENSLAGFEIRPAKIPAPGVTHAVLRSELRYDEHELKKAFEWASSRDFVPDKTLDDLSRRDEIRRSQSSDEGRQRRNALLQALGLDERFVDLHAEVDFEVAPEIEMFTA